ncbi:MAG TPA: hypothetical protein VGH49_20805 [Xanthobacteraceae bacterium]
MIAVLAAGLSPAAADEPVLMGTYTQNQVCKGDGHDAPKKLVTINEKDVVSNFGPCTFLDKETAGRTTKAHATCKSQSGEFDVALSFTLKDDNTIDFVEEGSKYKSVLYRCAAGAPATAPAPAPAPAK